MFQILGIFSGIEVSMTSGIYSVVARVYDMMIDLATYDDAIALTSLTNLTQTCYVLAGVFMLFRTVIGLIQMLVNPDKVNDGNAGAGKLISRIVISIVLLLVLQPQGILFNPSTGLFPRIENALLASDGLITNLIDGNVANSSGSDDSSNSNNSSSNVTGSIEEGAEAIKDVTQSTVNNNYSSIGDYLIEDVYADDKLICYYYDLEKVPDYSDPDAPDDITVSSFYKITFTTTKTNGYAKMRGLVAGDNVDGDVYYYVSNARVLSGEFGDDFRYQSLPNNRRLYDTDKLFYYSEGIWSWSDKRAVLPDKCPEYLDTSGGKNADIGVRKSAGNVRKGLIGGYTSPRAMIKDIDKTYEEENVTSNNNPAVESHDASNNNEFLTDLNHRDASLGFAQKAASSFHTCASGAEDECLDAQTEMFGSVEGNNNLENLIDEDKLDIGFIISMVVGIALMIYLLILCVDVIIRKFKLTLLQVIAPIPAISYVDPNDKIFNQWMKMYIATYVDLFIKLLAISLALGLLQGTLDSNIWGDNLLYRFFYIVAILVFAKLVPGMISKLFNLYSMGG